MIRRRWNKITYILNFYIICVGLCQDQCLRKCWRGMPGTQVAGASKVTNVASENECKDLCANNGTCVGIDWGGECWFQMTPTNNYQPRSDVSHWDLVNCSDDCLSYCWKQLKNNSGIYNGESRGSMDENRCKLLCSQTTGCTGVDWNIGDNSCWMVNYFGTVYDNRPGLHHWDIVRNSSTNCNPITNSTTSTASTTSTTSTASTTSTTSTASTTSTTSGRKSSELNQVSVSPLSEMPNPTGRDATNVTGSFQSARETKDSEESCKAAVIALAVLSGVFLVVIVALAVVLFRTTRLQRGQSSNSNLKEPDKPYDSLQLDTRSQDPDYADLQPTN